jgi:tetratricopeptide (TPR) repeat protein
MLIDSIEYKIASNTEEIKKAYELVYENYIEKKFCNLNYHKMRIFLFDSLTTTRTFIAKDGENVLATTTLVFDSPIGLPSEEIYKDRLETLRNQGKKICEISKLSTQRVLGAKALAILPLLFRSCWLYAKEINPHNHFCIMVEPQNEGFYKKYYYFENHSEIRLDHKANEASSILLEMPIDITIKPSLLKNARSNKIYQMHFQDPNCQIILTEFREAEANLSKINISLLAPRKNRTLALSGEEKKYLEFKFFIIRYNLEQISKYALSQSQKGGYHEAAESYERLMKTLPSWAFSKEKDQIYEHLCDFFFTTGAYAKLVEMGKRLQNSTNQSASIQGRNMQALGTYCLKEIEKSFQLLDEAEKMARELNEMSMLSHNLHIRAMILNHQGKHQTALPIINEALSVCQNRIPFRTNTYVFITAQAIFEHLGKIKDCKKITQIFMKEIPKPEEESNYKVLINYYSSLSRYSVMAINHQEAVNYFEIIIYKLGKKEEMPYNYAVHLSIYSRCLLFTGELQKAKQKITEALALKEYYFTQEYLSYLTGKFLILLFYDDQQKIDECKSEILNCCDKIGKKLEELTGYQQNLMLELQLKNNPSQLLKLLTNAEKITKWNKPQFSTEIDFATIYLLLGKPEKALKFLKKDFTPFELEIVGSEIDNKNLIQIYFNLANNKLNSLVNDVINLFQIDIPKNEIILKGLILLNMIRIIDLQNKKKPQQNFKLIRKQLIDLLTFIVDPHEIPIFNNLIANLKQAN